MTSSPDNLDHRSTGSYARLSAWHLAWVVVVLLGFVGVNAAAGGLSLGLLAALGCGIAPGLAAVLARPFDGPTARRMLLVIWALCGAAAAAVTGGLGGPLGLWCLAPLAVLPALGLGGSVGIAGGASFLAALGVIAAQVAGLAPAAPTGLTAFALGLTGLAAMAAGLAFSLLWRGDATWRAQDIAGDFPQGLHARLVVVGPDDHVVRAYGELPGLEIPVGAALLNLAGSAAHDAIAGALASARRGQAQTLDLAVEGAIRRVSLDLAPARGGYVVGLLRDATAGLLREEGLELSRADAENLAAGRARFLAGMSHELRTPLNAIMGFSDIMRNKMFGELPVKYGEYAELIHESGAHLLDLINDVLDMSKIEAHRYELNREFMDAREPVSAALRILRVQADAAGVKLRATLPPQPLDVDADRRAIKQIVINLVSNALKFTPRDGSVIVGLSGRGKDLDITVADTGIGISADDLQRIGRPYEQVGDPSRKASGTGLGLSLVRAFAELHGGQMVVESRLGEGTAVTVTMPVVVESEAAAPAPAPGNVVAFKPQR